MIQMEKLLTIKYLKSGKLDRQKGQYSISWFNRGLPVHGHQSPVIVITNHSGWRLTKRLLKIISG